jgi:hypothetical protein
MRALAIFSLGVLLAAIAFPVRRADAVEFGDLTFQSNATIQTITVNAPIGTGGNLETFTIAPAAPGCFWGAIKLIDPTSEIGKVMHGILVTARAANAKVQVGYHKVGADCTLYSLTYQ